MSIIYYHQGFENTGCNMSRIIGPILIPFNPECDLLTRIILFSGDIIGYNSKAIWKESLEKTEHKNKGLID